MTDAYAWFKFNCASWMMGRIQRLSFAHQGAFIRLCCVYWTKQGDISLEDAQLECTEELLEGLLKMKIVKEHDGVVSINFMDDLLEQKNGKSKSRKDAANARWEKANALQTDASALQTDASALQTDANAMQKERKKERKKERNEKSNEIFKTLQSYFGINEQKNFTNFRELDSFVMMLQNLDQSEYFLKQFNAYNKYKEKNNEKKHNFRGFIGTAQQQYQDGGWNADNWIHKIESPNEIERIGNMMDFISKMDGGFH